MCAVRTWVAIRGGLFKGIPHWANKEDIKSLKLKYLKKIKQIKSGLITVIKKNFRLLNCVLTNSEETFSTGLIGN